MDLEGRPRRSETDHEDDDAESTSSVSTSDSINPFEREESPRLLISLPGPSVARVTLGQRPTSAADWGIYGTVWEGGIALLRHILVPSASNGIRTGGEDAEGEPSAHGGRTLVLDLGSGTGVVGIGLARALLEEARGDAAGATSDAPPSDDTATTEILLTDLPLAVPLLRENVARNFSGGGSGGGAGDGLPASVSLDGGRLLLRATKLAWSAGPLPRDVRDSVCAADRVLVTGADVIYREAGFGPLLSALRALRDLTGAAVPPVPVRFLFGSMSKRTHLRKFWVAAEASGWDRRMISDVRVPKGCGAGVNLSDCAEIYRHGDKNDETQPQEGLDVVKIFELVPRD